MASAKYDVLDLRALGRTLLERAGLGSERSAVVADTLIESDLMGHSTHGLQLLAPYLDEIEAGRMTTEGGPGVTSDNGSSVLWDGRYLPGPWLVDRALDLAYARMKEHSVFTAVIRRSHHIAGLVAYLKQATDRGLVVLLMSSGPEFASVAPYGGCSPIYTPNPVAAGFPTDGEPVLFDICMSTTNNSLANRLRSTGDRFPGRWLIDGAGRETDDPAVLFEDPPGTILPLGGTDLGHKGFALGLLVEAMTSALGGFGRADHPQRWGASVFLQVLNPAAFGGEEAFVRETSWLARACQNARPISSSEPVRLPGHAGLTRRASALENGVELAPTVMPALEPWAEKFGLPLATPL